MSNEGDMRGYIQSPALAIAEMTSAMTSRSTSAAGMRMMRPHPASTSFWGVFGSFKIEGGLEIESPDWVGETLPSCFPQLTQNDASSGFSEPHEGQNITTPHHRMWPL